MVFPLLIPLAVGAAGLFTGMVSGGIGSEKHAPYETYAPQFTQMSTRNIQYPDYQIQIDSPGAIQSSKKEMRTTATQEPSQALDLGRTEGIPIIPIVIIGAIAIVASSYLGKKK